MSTRRFPPADLLVIIPSWEIECCAPPPTVGESTTWRLSFEPVPTPDHETAGRVPGSVTQQLWQIEAWPMDSDGRALYRNGVAAYRHQPAGAGSATAMPAPPLGRHLQRGVLFGTKHGGSDYDLFPTVSATVIRIQLISWELREQDQESLPIPGSVRLLDVQRSPKWFTRHPPGPVTSVPVDASGQWRRRVVPNDLVYRAETGILLTIRDTDARTIDRADH